MISVPCVQKTRLQCYLIMYEYIKYPMSHHLYSQLLFCTPELKQKITKCILSQVTFQINLVVYKPCNKPRADPGRLN